MPSRRLSGGPGRFVHGLDIRVSPEKPRVYAPFKGRVAPALHRRANPALPCRRQNRSKPVGTPIGWYSPGRLKAFRARAPSGLVSWLNLSIFLPCRPAKWGGAGDHRTAGEDWARIADLELRLGRQPTYVGRRWKDVPRRQPKLTAADRWFLDRMQPGHPERLTRDEEDVLGEALALEELGEYRPAQELLDALETEHRLRMELERSNCEGG